MQTYEIRNKYDFFFLFGDNLFFFYFSFFILFLNAI